MKFANIWREITSVVKASGVVKVFIGRGDDQSRPEHAKAEQKQTRADQSSKGGGGCADEHSRPEQTRYLSFYSQLDDASQGGGEGGGRPS